MVEPPDQASPPEALFFDFDGVLADSIPVKARAFARLFEPYGPEIVARVLDHHHRRGGLTRVERFRFWFAEYVKAPLTEDHLEDLCRRFADLVVDGVAASPEIPGARSFLETWQGRARMFVVSATPQKEIELIVEKRGLTPFFAEVRGAPAKKPDHIRELMTSHSLNPEQTVFFGDAETDFRAAEQTGIPFIGILPGPDAPLLQAHPQIRWYSDFNQVPLRPDRVDHYS